MENINLLTGEERIATKDKNKRTVSKHQASKKGYKHQHNLSKGQMKDYQKRMDANQK